MFHFAVIDPATHHPELDTFNKLVQREPDIRFSYHLPALFGYQSLNFVRDSIQGCVIFGSGASVFEALPWMNQLQTFLKESVVDKGLPLLGICFGHQLLAHMFGGEVEFATKDKKKFQELRQLQVSNTGGLSTTNLSIYMSHREIVREAGDEFDIFLSSERFAIEGLKHRSRPIWTIAGHPEATAGFLVNQDMDLGLGEQAFVDGYSFLNDFFRWSEALLKPEAELGPPENDSIDA